MVLGDTQDVQPQRPARAGLFDVQGDNGHTSRRRRLSRGCGSTPGCQKQCNSIGNPHKTTTWDQKITSAVQMTHRRAHSNTKNRSPYTCDPCMVRPAAPEETYQAPGAHRPEVETGPELSEWVMRHVSGIYKPQRTPRPKLGHARCFTEVYPHTGRSSGAVSGCKPSRQS